MAGNERAAFIPGLQLSRRFYHEIVHPILDNGFPDLPYASALIGGGSEVLGFDDSMSTDHHWGPRVMIFLREKDAHLATAIHDLMANKLPYTFLGYPTNFTPPDPNDNGTQLLQAIESGPVNHRIETYTLHGFFVDYLGFDIDQTIEPADWLTFPEQKLRAITSGAVFRDDIGLIGARSRFAYYPQDVWLYLLAAGWTRIGQEEHLMGRAGVAGDEAGSALIGARLVRDIMRLCFLMEKTYAPYPKWFGAAFKQLSCANTMWPSLEAALHAQTWQKRDQHLAEAYEALATLHNNLQLTDPLPARTRSFFGRPFRVIALHGYANAILRRIGDPIVQKIAQRPIIGGIDQFSDNTDLLENPSLRPVLRRLYSG
jgi:hypothetical protein